MASGSPFFASLAYGFDAANLYLKVETQEGAELQGTRQVEIYLAAPGQGPTAQFSANGSLLGFPANRLVRLELENGQLAGAGLLSPPAENSWEGELLPLEQAAMAGGVIEVAVPIAELGGSETGDRIAMRAVEATLAADPGLAGQDGELLPSGGPAVVAVPDLGTVAVLLEVNDPERDDTGNGSYTYATDPVFTAGSFDILNFQAGADEENVVFKFTLRGPVENVWGSPNGLSIQTFDIYIDKDGDGQGGAAFLPGRNLSLQDGFAWDLAITVEGWESGVFEPGPEGPARVAQASEVSVLADPGQQKVTIRIPKSILGDDPAAWRFAAMVLGQEGFPAGGVMRVRDVNPSAEQWRFGGAPEGATNITRVIDLVWPEAGQQEQWLSELNPVQTPQTGLVAEDFARVPMLAIEE
jgi:carbohydrate-binding DOMON domain-containing protein